MTQDELFDAPAGEHGKAIKLKRLTSASNLISKELARLEGEVNPFPENNQANRVLHAQYERSRKKAIDEQEFQMRRIIRALKSEKKDDD